MEMDPKEYSRSKRSFKYDSFSTFPECYASKSQVLESPLKKKQPNGSTLRRKYFPKLARESQDPCNAYASVTFFQRVTNGYLGNDKNLWRCVKELPHLSLQRYHFWNLMNSLTQENDEENVEMEVIESGKRNHIIHCLKMWDNLRFKRVNLFFYCHDFSNFQEICSNFDETETKRVKNMKTSCPNDKNYMIVLTVHEMSNTSIYGQHEFAGIYCRSCRPCHLDLTRKKNDTKRKKRCHMRTLAHQFQCGKMDFLQRKDFH